MDAIRKLVSTAVILANLPAKPGTNGAVLLIDDEEAARCVDEINAAILEFEALRKDAEPHAAIAGTLADEIKAAIFKYEGQIPLALAIGVLRIVEKELLDDA